MVGISCKGMERKNRDQGHPMKTLGTIDLGGRGGADWKKGGRGEEMDRTGKKSVKTPFSVSSRAPNLGQLQSRNGRMPVRSSISNV